MYISIYIVGIAVLNLFGIGEVEQKIINFLERILLKILDLEITGST